jgi:glutamine synthetase
VAEGLVPPLPVAEDPGTWSDAERAANGIVALPTTQAGQEEALLASPRVTAALGHDLLGAFLAVRRSDAAAAEGKDLDDVLSALRWRY